MRRLWLLLTLSGIMITPLSLSPLEVCHASEYEDDTLDIYYSSGTVAKIGAPDGSITITEYDWYDDVEIDVVYSIDPDVKIDGIPSWKDIPVGSYVDIDYKLGDNGKKIATYISVFIDDREVS